MCKQLYVIKWECGNCGQYGQTQQGYWIRCSCKDATDYKFNEVRVRDEPQSMK